MTVNNGKKCMMACRVLIGDIAKGEQNCEPPLKSDGHTRVETLVNNVQNPTIFVTTRDYCALPVYYIWFEKGKESDNDDGIFHINNQSNQLLTSQSSQSKQSLQLPKHHMQARNFKNYNYNYNYNYGDFVGHMTLAQCRKLGVNDKIDHRCVTLSMIC